ncbi:MAG: MBL fold metallo-hydrolase [Pyrodictiaceae archaeon]
MAGRGYREVRFEDLVMLVFQSYRPPLDSPANATLVVSKDTVFLVDAGALEFHRELIDKSILYKPMAAFITHYHWDHTLGLIGLLDRVGDIIVTASREAISFLSDPEKPKNWAIKVFQAMGISGVDDLSRMYESKFMVLYKRLVEKVNGRLKPLEEVATLAKKLGISYIQCPGHTTCHVCYKYKGILFAGDTVIPTTSPVILNILSYVESLAKLVADNSWRLLVPGHGDILDRHRAEVVIRGTLLRKLERLRTLVGLLASLDNSWLSFPKLVEALYGSSANILADFPKAYNLIGYVEPLESEGVLEINKSVSPWRLRLHSKKEAEEFLARLWDKAKPIMGGKAA